MTHTDLPDSWARPANEWSRWELRPHAYTLRGARRDVAGATEGLTDADQHHRGPARVPVLGSSLEHAATELGGFKLALVGLGVKVTETSPKGRPSRSAQTITATDQRVTMTEACPSVAEF
jgi:hypothetical protein